MLSNISWITFDSTLKKLYGVPSELLDYNLKIYYYDGFEREDNRSYVFIFIKVINNPPYYDGDDLEVICFA